MNHYTKKFFIVTLLSICLTTLTYFVGKGFIAMLKVFL